MSDQTESQDRSPVYYYVCQHAASNSPCPEGCFPRESKVMPDNWNETYVAENVGVSDSTNLT